MLFFLKLYVRRYGIGYSGYLDLLWFDLVIFYFFRGLVFRVGLICSRNFVNIFRRRGFRGLVLVFGVFKLYKLGSEF